METSSTCIKLVIHSTAFNPHQLSNLAEISRNASAPDQGMLRNRSDLFLSPFNLCCSYQIISAWYTVELGDASASDHRDWTLTPILSFCLWISAFGNSKLSHEKSITEARQFTNTLFCLLFVCLFLLLLF